MEGRVVGHLVSGLAPTSMPMRMWGGRKDAHIFDACTAK